MFGLCKFAATIQILKFYLPPRIAYFMQRYTNYRKTLDTLLAEAEWGRMPIPERVVHPHLNGGAAAKLTELVSRAQIRRAGAFFTGEELGRRLVQAVPNDFPAAAAWDPNCGAGDLLLRWAERLPVAGDLKETLHCWGEQLHGQDIHLEFLEVAKRRLTLAAIHRGAKLKRGVIDSFDKWFPNLNRRSLLCGKAKVPASAVILMNPPFTMIATPRDCTDWSSGRVSFAAVALLKCLSSAAPGQRVCAILPDVLRSGSRYHRWRARVAGRLKTGKAQVIGKFGDQADVDVFVLDGIVGDVVANGFEWTNSAEGGSERTLGSLCEVRVGTVVPHRHKPNGKPIPYLTTAEAPSWGEIAMVRKTLRFTGTCVQAPFVCVRRTSSPSDGTRAVATFVDSRQPVALENHLISIRPLSGSSETCRKLLKYLGSEEVRKWLDQRIRCRHLTVGSIRQIPVPANL